MFRCTVCGTMGRNPATCALCGGTVNETPSRQSVQVLDAGTKSRRSIRGARIGTRLAWIIIATILFSAVAAGAYVSTRPPSPTCTNQAVNYPSCNACLSTEIFNQTKTGCLCTNDMANPPYCNRPCSNNAINPPPAFGAGYSNISGGSGCDQCSDGQTDPNGGYCTAGMRPFSAQKLPTENHARPEHQYS